MTLFVSLVHTEDSIHASYEKEEYLHEKETHKPLNFWFVFVWFKHGNC